MAAEERREAIRRRAAVLAAEQHDTWVLRHPFPSEGRDSLVLRRLGSGSSDGGLEVGGSQRA